MNVVLKSMTMGRISCFFLREEAVSEPPLVPTRPIFNLPHRPRHASKRPNPQPELVEVNQVPVNGRLFFELPPIAMNNAEPPWAYGGKEPLQNYVDLVSDDEDEDEEDLIALQDPYVPLRPNSVLHDHNAHLPAPNGDGLLRRAPPGLLGQAQVDVDFGAFEIEDGDELDVNDPLLAQIMLEGFNREHHEVAARIAQPGRQSDQPDRHFLSQSSPLVDDRIQCIDQVILVFPDICRDHVSDLYATVSQLSELLIADILDKVDHGEQYPKARETQNRLKRKRGLNEDEEAARKYGSPDRVIPEGAGGLRPYM